MRIGQTLGITSGSNFGARSISAADPRADARVEPAAFTAPTGSDAPRPATDARALAPTAARAAEDAADRLVRYRIQAPFLAQLIATRDGAPDTRRLRRAPPRRAAQAYATAMAEPGLLVPGYFVDTAL